MPLSVDSTQLAEPVSSVPQAFCQLSFSSLPEKQWKCVCPLWLAQSEGEPSSLENTDRLPRPTRLQGFQLVLAPLHAAHLCHRTHHSCPVPLPLLPSTNTRVASGE